MTDLRIKTNILDHHKFKRLIAEIGEKGFVQYFKLICWVADNRPKGILSNMDIGDIEMHATWDGEKGEFINLLSKLKLIDKTKNWWKLHNWKTHQGFIYFKPERSAQAKKAAKSRWDKKNGGMRSVNNQHSGQQPISNAPLPSPNPLPLPSPKPNNMSSNADHSKFVEYYCNTYKEKFNTKYAFDGGKDANLIKTLLTQFDYAVLCDMAVLFFKDESDFVAGHTIGKFKFQSQALAEKLINPKQSADDIGIQQLRERFPEDEFK